MPGNGRILPHRARLLTIPKAISYPSSMLRCLQISVTLLLAATYAFAMPVHLAFGHGHDGHDLFGVPDNYVHMHADCHDDHACDVVDEDSRSEIVEIACAANCCAPHSHEAHCHDADESGIAPSRVKPLNFEIALLPVAPAASIERLPSDVLARQNAPPFPSPFLTHPSLRAPPALG